MYSGIIDVNQLKLATRIMNPLFQKSISVIFLFCSILLSTFSHAVEVVRANFEFQGANYPIDISLFETVASGTVSNFLSYVDDSFYNKLLVNRSVPDFIIQAGAYTYDPLVGDGSFSYDGNLQFSGGLQLVSSKGAITNEFKLSNLRGTIAMAKVSGDIHSASNQWFLNLADNSSLDAQLFTVFGEVLGKGMDSIDLVSAMPTYDLSGEIDLNASFLTIPLVDFTISSIIRDITNTNLVMINSIERLFKITDTIDFGDTEINTTTTGSIEIRNKNIAELDIGTIDTSSLAAPFSVTANPCQNITLQLDQACFVEVEFSPVSDGVYADIFNIEIVNYGYTFPVLLKTPVPEIDANPDIVEFGAHPVYDPLQNPPQAVVYLNNNGVRTLNISSITFNTQTPDEFSFIDNCTANSAYPPGTVPPDAFCILVINFKPADLAEKDAIISIISDDPLNRQLDIQVTGGASSDNDGIKNAIEDAAPNNGDGNNDEIPDRLQNSVVSFPNTNNTYTTLITDKGMLFTEVKPVQLSTIEKIPDGISLDNEAFSFKLSGFPAGEIIEFGLILPAGRSPDNIYSFGPTGNNDTPHWYTLEQNTAPGVFIYGGVSLFGTAGDSISRNVTSVSILDGGDGDADQLANGIIVFVGGPEITNQGSPTTGSLLWMLFITPFSIIVYRRQAVLFP